MPQADITLNLLRSSRRQPKLSAYACLNGAFNFNQSPLAPTGTRAVIHVTPDKRHNMAPHGVDGWYVGPSPEHYRCHKCYIPSTFGIRDALTNDWFPHSVPFPKVGTDEYLQQTATDMLALVQDSTMPPVPSLTYGSSVTNAYIQIAQILKRATASPIPPAPLPLILKQRVPMDTPPVPEQRVLAQPPPPLASPQPPLPLRYAQPQRRLHSRPVHPSHADKAAARSGHQADTPMAH
jgi:hypothetical protein